jgi:hypothetical protein
MATTVIRTWRSRLRHLGMVLGLAASSWTLASEATPGAVCKERPQAPDSAKVAGHYYLSGVREVGSELLLRADGRFQWMFAYGAMDFVAEGRWWRNAGCIGLAREQGAQVPFQLLRRDGDEQTRATYADMDKYPMPGQGDRLLVYAFEASHGMSADGLEVALRWADGQEQTVVAEGGAALFEPRPGMPVQVGARWPRTGMQMTWMQVDADARWPLLMRLDVEALSAAGDSPMPTFLRIDDEALVPTWPGDERERGRYERQ